jgi:HEAT repeat protein
VPYLPRLPLISALAVAALASFAIFTTFTASALPPGAMTTHPRVEFLTEQLHATQPRARAQAALALSGVNDRRANTALLANLQDDNPTVGYYSALAVGYTADEEVVDALIAQLDNTDGRARQWAMFALSRMHVPAAVPALARALEDEATAIPAARLLVQINDQASHAVILNALTDDALTTRRHAVMGALAYADRATQGLILGRALTSENLLLKRNAMQLRDFLATAN